jgi:hemolysin activation/secretion protein
VTSRLTARAKRSLGPALRQFGAAPSFRRRRAAYPSQCPLYLAGASARKDIFFMISSSKWLALCALASGMAGVIDAQAQEHLPQLPTDSGSLLRSNPGLDVPDAPRATTAPEARKPQAPDTTDEGKGPSFHVERIDVDGVPEKMRLEVEAVVAPYQGRKLTFDDLQQAAAEVTQALTASGEYLGYALIPPQKSDTGVVRMEIVLANLESLRLGENESLVSDRVLNRFLNQAKTGSTDFSDAQNQILRMSDLPGVGTISPVLSPGDAPRTSAMTVDVAPAERVSAVLVADNSGQTSTGRNRLGAQLTVNSPLGIGDRVQLVGFAAPDFFQGNHDSDGGYSIVGRASYDLPVGGYGTRVGAAVSRVNFLLGGRYLNRGFGYANVFSLYANHPVVRANRYNFNVNASLDYKQMKDVYVGSPNKRDTPVLTLGTSGDLLTTPFGRLNRSSFQFNVSGGHLHYADSFYDAGRGGNFLKSTQSVKVTQGIVRGVYVDLSADGQMASHNLDGAEKMTLGGPNAVRAYSNDTVSADLGVLASATFNFAVPKVNGLVLKAFYDVAHGHVDKFSRRRNNAVDMSGYGVGASYTIARRANLSLTYARPNGHSDVGQRPSGMMWVSLTARVF